MHATHNDLSLEVRSQSVAILNAMLADMIDLQRQAKQAHWNVRGPHFISLHKLFDEIAGEFDDIIDDIAERITALGGVAHGTLPEVAAHSSLPAYPLYIKTGHDHLAALIQSFAHAAKHVRTAIDTTAALADAGTADLFTGACRAILTSACGSLKLILRIDPLVPFGE